MYNVNKWRLTCNKTLLHGRYKIVDAIAQLPERMHQEYEEDSRAKSSADGKQTDKLRADFPVSPLLDDD